MEVKDLIRQPDPRAAVRADVREVVRDVRGVPHVLLRVRLTGWHFKQRSAIPFLVVGDVISKFVLIDRDGLGASAYFDRPLPPAERVSFGYGRTITWDFDVAIDPQGVERLDRARLPREAVDPFR